VIISLKLNPMPNCRHCGHKGSAHNWTVPECSLCFRRDPGCANCRRNRERRRVRGVCLYNGKRRCICTKYAPVSDEPKPVNPFVGRARYRKGR
jgi:hypothetical protein